MIKVLEGVTTGYVDIDIMIIDLNLVSEAFRR